MREQIPKLREQSKAASDEASAKVEEAKYLNEVALELEDYLTSSGKKAILPP